MKRYDFTEDLLKERTHTHIYIDLADPIDETFDPTGLVNNDYY
jgi:hypothetical protein